MLYDVMIIFDGYNYDYGFYYGYGYGYDFGFGFVFYFGFVFGYVFVFVFVFFCVFDFLNDNNCFLIYEWSNCFDEYFVSFMSFIFCWDYGGLGVF